MNEALFEWSLLLGRWIHITTAICWIGTSIFFMWMDRSFKKSQNVESEGHVGELWMVHGGGFYKVEKLLMGPTKVPPLLHWFKWEAYATWISGIFLLFMMFYFDGGEYLVDVDVADISTTKAIAIGVFSIFGSWFLYDFLWESKLSEKALFAHFLTLFYSIGITYFLCTTLQSRAAYIHIAAMIGTWMAGNVLMRIIPRMKTMVEDSSKGEKINPKYAINAKNRSTHNTYFTLPIIFIMFSNHFPNIYGHKYNWILLIFMSIAGASIRHFFVIRENSKISKWYFLLGILFISLTFFASLSES